MQYSWPRAFERFTLCQVAVEAAATVAVAASLEQRTRLAVAAVGTSTLTQIRVGSDIGCCRERRHGQYDQCAKWWRWRGYLGWPDDTHCQPPEG
jgi:hypothetical protein